MGENEENNSVADNINDAIEALLSGNKLRFKEIMDSELHTRAIDAVSAWKDELATSMFNDSGVEDDDEESETDESEEELEGEEPNEGEEESETDESEEE